MSMNFSSCSSLMCWRATAPTLKGSQRANPRQASGALKNTLVRYAGSSSDSNGIASRQLNTCQQVS